jgi:hypothetical protein
MKRTKSEIKSRVERAMNELPTHGFDLKLSPRDAYRVGNFWHVEVTLPISESGKFEAYELVGLLDAISNEYSGPGITLDVRWMPEHLAGLESAVRNSADEQLAVAEPPAKPYKA